MFYRRKVILAILQKFGGEINSTDFQKYLFLFTQMQVKPSFEFVPYNFGCFSFQSMADKSAMTKYDLIENSPKWEMKVQKNFIRQLTVSDQQNLIKLYEKFNGLKGKALLKYVYKQYPYYAINSTILEETLSTVELREIFNHEPIEREKEFFTIGYEGRTLENFLNILIQNNIGLLCDVRKNPFSMKFGFSKNQLRSALENLHIEYKHFPELGIESHKRQNLDSKESYKQLFESYEKNELALNSHHLEILHQLLNSKKRIAITCFEKSHEFCHRGVIAKVLEQSPSWNSKITHL